jgi:hypothetical protein
MKCAHIVSETEQHEDETAAVYLKSGSSTSCATARSSAFLSNSFFHLLLNLSHSRTSRNAPDCMLDEKSEPHFAAVPNATNQVNAKGYFEVTQPVC